MVAMNTRGKRRGDTAMARTLALFDTIGVKDGRKYEFRVRLSRRTAMSVMREAAERRVFPQSIAAFYIEKALRS